MSRDRSDASRQHRALIESKLTDTHHQAHGAESGEDLRKANELLRDILELLKDKTQRMLRDDHDACWNRWLEVKEIIKYKREEIASFNYGAFRDDAYEAKGIAAQSPKDAKQKVRRIQRAMKGRTMERWQFDEINGVLQDTWNIAMAAYQRRREEREQEQQQWRERMSAAKSRKLELINRNRTMIENLESQIDRCKDMLHNTKSPEFEQRIQEWIDEKHGKIRDIERFTADLEAQIRSIDVKVQ